MSLKEAAGLFRVGAPFHPISVHFTIALTASSLAFDTLGFFTGRASLTAAGGWTLTGSALMTLMTILTGLTSAARAPLEEDEARSFLRAHMALGLAFYGLLVAMTLWRLSLWQAGAGVSWWYLAAVETPRLLLNSASALFPHGLANSSGLVGKCFMVHSGHQVFAKFPSRINQYKAPPPGGALTEHFNRTMPEEDFVCGYTIEVVGPHPVDFASRLTTARGLWGAELRRAMLDYNSTRASASSAKSCRSRGTW